VSEYGLDDRANGVRSPAEAKDFSSSLCVQTSSEAHPASCTMGTGGPFPGAKLGRGVTLTAHPHLVPMSRMSRSYNSSPPSTTMACNGTALLCFALLGHLGRGIPLLLQNNTTQKHETKKICKRNSNSRFQRRSRPTPQTVRPLGPVYFDGEQIQKEQFYTILRLQKYYIFLFLSYLIVLLSHSRNKR
jgi:hypothetical protein